MEHTIKLLATIAIALSIVGVAGGVIAQDWWEALWALAAALWAVNARVRM